MDSRPRAGIHISCCLQPEGEHLATKKARPFGDRLFDVFSYSRCSEGDVVAVGILEVVLQGMEFGHGLYLEGFAIFLHPLVTD